MMKKLTALILALCMVFALVACGNNSANEPAQEDENAESVIHVATEVDPATFTPYGANKGRQNFIRNLYETIGRLNPDMELDLVLGKSWEEVEPGVYEVTLYDYITDSDGNPLKASDVAFSFDKFREEAADQKCISSLDRYEVTGDYTIRFYFENPKAGAFQVAMEGVRIITQAAWEECGDSMAARPVGTAPYVLEEYKPGEYGLLAKRDDYWQTDESLIGYTSTANVDKIYLDIITDYSTQALALLSGDLDLSQYITTTDMGSFVNDDVTPKDDFTISTALTARQYIMVFNCGENSQCSDINLRKAIASCIDKAAVARKAFGITARYPETVIWQYYKEWDESMKTRYSYDLEEAKAYLAKSSYDGSPIRMLCYADFNSDAALMIQDACRQAGIDIQLIQTTQAEYSSLHSDTTGLEYDIDLNAPNCTGYAWDPMSLFSADNYSNGLPHTFLKDDKLQELYDTMASAATNSIETVAEFADYVDEMCYGIGLGSNEKIVVGSAKVASIMQDNYASVVLGGTTVD